MTYVLVLLLALLIGVVAGLRALTAPAVVAWAGGARLDRPGRHVGAVGGHPITVTVLTILALGELVTDQLPKTPSRRVPHAVRRTARHRRVRRRGDRHGRRAEPDGVGRGRRDRRGVIGAVLGTLGGARRADGWSPPTADTTCRSRWSRTPSRSSAGSRSSRWRRSSECATAHKQIRCDHRRRRPGGSATGRPADRRRADRRGDRAQTGRRHLRQQRLHPDQDAGGQRARRAHGPPRRRIRHRHRRCHAST